MQTFLKAYLLRKCQELVVHVLAIGMNPDHIHMVLSLKPSHSIPEIVRTLKGGSAYAANHASPPIGIVHWQRGYSIRTVSERNLEIAKAHVNHQAQHHGYQTAETLERLKEEQTGYHF